MDQKLKLLLVNGEEEKVIEISNFHLSIENEIVDVTPGPYGEVKPYIEHAQTGKVKILIEGIRV